ncbi:MAG: hypothetical protein GY711_18210 [bacterium]|nr:hypothetical protein [bacterium]
MTSRFLFTALIATPLLLALQPRADAVHFQPEDGSSLAKEFSIEFTLSVGDITAFIDGQDLSEGIPADLELAAEAAMLVTDEYLETVDGVPHEFIRTYDSLELYWEADDDSGEVDEFSELEGKSVKFDWDEEDESYQVTFHESDGDEDLLQGLGADMDLRVLLPEGDVSEGDTWTVEATDLGAIFFFGSKLEDLEIGDEEDADTTALIESELYPQFESMLDGFITECTYEGDGTIGVSLQGEGSIDLTSFIEEIAALQVPDGFEFDLNVDEAVVGINVDGEATLVWDLEAGHMTSFDMTSDFEILADVYIEVDLAGEAHELDASIELLGEGAWEVGLVE